MTKRVLLMEVFEFARAWAEELVPVFAVDLDHAEAIYAEWIKTHHPGRPTVAHMIYPSSTRLLWQRPELRDASALGIAGVGCWDRSAFRWQILQPAAASAGDLVWPTSTIQYYRVRASDGDELMVFTTCYAEAVASYVEWHLDAYGSQPDGIQVSRLSRWQLFLALAPLRDAMDAGISGVASWSEEDGWHVDVSENGTVVGN